MAKNVRRGRTHKDVRGIGKISAPPILKRPLRGLFLDPRFSRAKLFVSKASPPCHAPVIFTPDHAHSFQTTLGHE